MSVTGGILVAGSASRCLYSAAGMLRFLARLSGRRRHVRRNCGGVPGASTNAAELSSSQDHEEEVRKLELDGQLMIDPRRISEDSLNDVRQRYFRCRRQIEDNLVSRLINNNNNNNDDDDDDEKRWKVDEVDFSRSKEESIERISGFSVDTTTETTATTTTTTTRKRRFQDDLTQSSRTSTNNSCCGDEFSRSNGVARFRRRRNRIPSYLATLLVLSYTFFGIADACSSRSTPKPRPPTPTPRPNITFPMYTCPADYAQWYCLNGASCFTVRIQESLLYNCLCADGFMGQRCEFKDLDGSYMSSKRSGMLETASIASGATIAVFLVVIICIALYIQCKRKQKELRTSSTGIDTVDGPGRDPELRPFSNRNRSVSGFKAKHQNFPPAMCLSIEQTRMPGWIDYSQVEMTRLASINEAKRSSQ